MGKFGSSFNGCSNSRYDDVKRENISETIYSRIGCEQGYGSSLYAILLDDRLCKNKYLKKLNPLNHKVKKFFNNSSKTSNGYFHTPTTNFKTENPTSCLIDASGKNSSLKSKKKVSFKNLKQLDTYESTGQTDYNSGLCTLYSQNIPSSSKFSSSEYIEKESQQILISQSTQTNGNPNLYCLSSKSFNVKKNQPQLSEIFSTTELDTEIDIFLRKSDGHTPLLPPTSLNDIEQLVFSKSSLSLPLRNTNGRTYHLSNIKQRTISGYNLCEQITGNVQTSTYSQMNKQIGSKSYFPSAQPLTTLYEEEDYDDDCVKMCSKKFSYSMNAKSTIVTSSYEEFGRSMNMIEIRNLKLKPMIDIPKKISNSVLKTFFDRNAEKRAYIIRSEERKSSKGWTNVNRYSQRKVKPIPSGCWVQGKDDDKILANNGSLKVITITIINCPHLEEFNLGIHLEDILLENFILVGGKGSFDFYTRDTTIFNEFLDYLFEHSTGIKLPYIDEIVNFEIAP
uniref:Ras-GAP domain-containing protein n=1 Tax=Strongyloides venezuelensis TaxID=75913 RepID=A0A0K0EVD2_STRVS